MKAAGLRRRLRAALGERTRALDAVRDEARAHGVASYLVGGPVRDLICGAPVGDLDFLLSGGCEEVARGVALRLAGEATLHPRFLTAHVAAGACSVDLARARRERYRRPGALPETEPCEVDEDFARRDFTVHAMALPLDEGSGERLLDPLGGRRDLRARQLRALHPASFRDDPTRLLRAARYAARLGFALEPGTARWLREAVRDGALDRLSGERIAHEVERTLDEARPAAGFARTERSGLLEALAPGWALDAGARRALAALGRLRARPPWPGADAIGTRLEAGLRILLLAVRSGVRSRVLERLGRRGRLRARALEDLASLPRTLAALERPASPGRIDARLEGAGEPFLVLAWCAAGPRGRRPLRRWAVRDRHRPAPLDGHAARALGLEGPAVGELLRAARRRALDGGAVDERWLRAWMARRARLR